MHLDPHHKPFVAWVAMQPAAYCTLKGPTTFTFMNLLTYMKTTHLFVVNHSTSSMVNANRLSPMVTWWNFPAATYLRPGPEMSLLRALCSSVTAAYFISQ